MEFIICPMCQSRHLPLNDENASGTMAGSCQNCKHIFKFRQIPESASKITFSINGTPFTVDSNQAVSTRLSEFIRDVACLKGTKVMCHQGGCGACIVLVKHTVPSTEAVEFKAINSCLCPIFSCDGWEITTTEGLGNQKTGFNVIQQSLADFNGSQCGFCSPGMVMSMKGLFSNNKKPTADQVERALDGNICRCTGFRPILDAMKSVAMKVADLEDIAKCSGSTSCKQSCSAKREFQKKVEPVHMVFTSSQWYRPTSIDQLYDVMKANRDKLIKLVVGNTAQGVYGDGAIDVYIDTKSVPELYHIKYDPEFTIASNVTLSRLISVLTEQGKRDGYTYCTTLADHVQKVASTPVRNMASWSGNLMLKKQHPSFISDIYVILETVGATLSIVDVETKVAAETNLSDFLKLNMQSKMIASVKLPKMSEDNNQHVLTYKIMPRAENAHAYVNAGFRMEIHPNHLNYLVVNKPSIVYGGISPGFVHASKTEEYLTGKCLGDVKVLQGALHVLASEVVPNEDPVLSSPQYRKNLALSLLYKFVLNICQETVSARFKSGADCIQRPLSSGKQSYDTHKKQWPLSEPIPKLKSKLQASGETVYPSDMASQSKELHGMFVLATVANATIETLDAPEALVSKVEQ
ncbi:unnamed protein product [Owenia fusiformis]|uniref:Aldehyde oxidase n=1 Tax=Owenia fusiformis TaxID=6347 RepID=A0A8S4P3D5_OWEFU|nr:unnamed protein product [Owenia fusiformis]